MVRSHCLSRGADVTRKRTQNSMLQGNLDLLILQTLSQGTQHGYAIARHIHEVSNAFFQIEEGSLYPALHRLELRGLVSSSWGPSEANRKAKFYKLTASGKKALKEQASAWQEMNRAISSILNFQPKEVS